MNVSRDGRPGEERVGEGNESLTGVMGGEGGAGIVVEHAITEEVRSAR